MKKAVVSFANTPDYLSKMNRLENSLKGNFDGDFIGFTRYEEIGCKTHQDVPYQFKPFAIQKAVDMGYELILWCDSPIIAIKDIQPVFEHIETYGLAFFDNIGHSVGKWSNQKALDAFKISREDANNVKMIMACCMGFDFSYLEAKTLFDSYKNLSDELYPGSWADHRHDQTVMSLLLHKRGYDILNGQQTFFAYEQHREVLEIADSVCLISK